MSWMFPEAVFRAATAASYEIKSVGLNTRLNSSYLSRVRQVCVVHLDDLISLQQLTIHISDSSSNLVENKGLVLQLVTHFSDPLKIYSLANMDMSGSQFCSRNSSSVSVGALTKNWSFFFKRFENKILLSQNMNVFLFFPSKLCKVWAALKRRKRSLQSFRKQWFARVV